jgi:predicted glycoside hydrolase/deacetylase ChbG (UPF0249 family)
MPVPDPATAAGVDALPPNLLVNADDFGLDPRISLAIARCAREGLVHSLSAVPFRDGFHADLLRGLRKECPRVRIGAHLTLVEFPYLVPGGPARADGMPPADFRAFLGQYLRGKVDMAWVYRDWTAQIDLLASRLGRAPDHLDSHQHLHVFPGLWSAALRLQREFGIPRLRVPYESLGRGLCHRFPFGLALQALAFARSRQRAGANAFIGFFTSTSFTVAANRAALRSVPAHPDMPFELMVHPALGEAEARPAVPRGEGRPGVDAPFRSRVKASQEREMEELARLREFYRKAGRTGGD